MSAARRAAIRPRQQGQTLIVFALGFALLLFTLTCLVADAAFLYVWSGRVQAAAQLGAQSGADSVDPRYLYQDATQCAAAPMTACALQIVDIAATDSVGGLYAFQRACIQTGDQSAQVPRTPGVVRPLKTADDPQTPDGTLCDSDGCRVFAQVSRVIQLPIPIPGFPDTVTVRASGYAAPVVGTHVATSTCTGVRWVPAPPP